MYASSRVLLAHGLLRRTTSTLCGVTRTPPARLPAPTSPRASVTGGKRRKGVGAKEATATTTAAAAAAANGQSSGRAHAQAHVFLHEDVFVANARRAFDSLLSPSTAAANARDDAVHEGRATMAEGAAAAPDSLAEDFEDLSSVREAPYTYADDELTAAEVAQNTTNGEEEFAFLADAACSQLPNQKSGADERCVNTDVDAADATDPHEAVTARSTEQSHDPAVRPAPSTAPAATAVEANRVPQVGKEATTSYRTEFGQSCSAETGEPVKSFELFHPATRTAAAAEEALSSGAYTPMSLKGNAYHREVAAALKEAAAANGFVSPFWASIDGFSERHIPVDTLLSTGEITRPTSASVSSTRTTAQARHRENDEVGSGHAAEGEGRARVRGVLVSVLQCPFTLFNLEQTDLPRELARSLDLKQLRSWIGRHERAAAEARKPKNILGSYLKATAVKALHTHPHFAALQRACPMWISASEVRQIGASVRDGEEQHFALRENPSPGGGLFAPGHRDFAASHPEARREVEAQSQRIGVDLMTHTVYYNVHQLADRARFLAFPPLFRLSSPASSRDATGAASAALLGEEVGEEEGVVKEKPDAAPTADAYDTRFFRCYSLHGRTYSTSTSFLMREYCRRYNLPSTGAHLWVTEAALRRYGGSVLDTPRTARDAAFSRARDVCGHRVPRRLPLHGDEALPDDAVDGDEDGAGAASQPGVVPPPFSAAIYGDIITLLNVGQTDMADVLWDEFRRAKATRADHFRARAWSDRAERGEEGKG